MEVACRTGCAQVHGGEPRIPCLFQEATVLADRHKAGHMKNWTAMLTQ